MGYMKIENLYKRPDILQCYALEKIHGTSAHILITNAPDGKARVQFYSGGESHDRFIALFDENSLLERFGEKFGGSPTTIIFYGEAFGGKQQGMSATYGPDLRFLVFDVKLNGGWLRVPSAESLTKNFDLGFVPYEMGPLTLEFLDEQRDRDSLVSPYPGKMREGVVIRPIHESMMQNGRRFIIKHRRDEFRETKTPRMVSPEKLKVLEEANAVAEEWVTPMRLQHVLQKTPFNSDKDTRSVLMAMVEDVRVEGEGEIVWSKDVEKAICRATAKMLHEKNAMQLAWRNRRLFYE